MSYDGPKVIESSKVPFAVTVAFGAISMASFLAAMAMFPGGGYNPLMRMLSALGRTVIRGVEWPWCRYLFIVGMISAAVAVLSSLLSCRRLVGGTRRRVLVWGAVLNAMGMLAIAAVPENVNMMLHNVGCWLAAGGGGMALFALDRRATSRAWTVLLCSVIGVFCIALALNAFHAVPFSPAIPTMQKVVIVSFSAWIIRLVLPLGSGFSRRAAAGIGFLLLLSVSFFMARGLCGMQACVLESAASLDVKPFTDDERAALRWLEHVTGVLPPDAERDWWKIGGSQHGLFAKRYNIAFCGYAAAALGWRGGEDERRRAGQILGNCISRYLKRDVWAYSQSKNYWGLKPWAPDPCYRENVMYTGHLLQLLALYELFTGDVRYWREGFDFVWKDGRKVHYDVRKLLDVTVAQMRKGASGGIACEPDLLFFPCNNHPHIARALFARLGHKENWAGDAQRWESWALKSYRNPLFGGGALNLVYHVKSGLMYPRGHNGLDGWSMLWYEPWATNRGFAIAIWREAAKRIDWKELETGRDARKGGFSCCDPVDVSPMATVTFLSAAARACDDPETAERLERIAERRLVRRDGMLWLDVGRDWRIGATANYILSIAESNGFRFRDMLGR